MKVDIAIRNGFVIDPETNRELVTDICVKEGRIVDPGPVMKAEFEYDASGMFVLPGLIDYHLHVFPGSTEIGIPADISLLPQGVTTAVDAGSAGTANVSSFINQVVNRNSMRIKAFLNLCPAGLVTSRYHENVDPRHWDREAIGQLLESYPNFLKGLKIRISRPIVQELGLTVLEEAVKFAEELGTRIAVHVTDPPASMDDVAGLLRQGDILVHCFHGTGLNILNSQGKVSGGVLAARKRGVVMDAANGRNHWAFAVAEAAIKQGFEPDIISTDLTARTLFRDPVFSLPYLMSKYLMMGMSMQKVVAACTAKPASLLGMRGLIGTLASGAFGDIGVFEMKDHVIAFSDTNGVVRTGQKILSPKLTVLNGKVVSRNW